MFKVLGCFSADRAALYTVNRNNITNELSLFFSNASALAVKRYVIVLSFVEVCKCWHQLLLFEELIFLRA